MKMRNHLEQDHQNHNFTLPIPIHGLESELVSLVPFDPLRHASIFHTASSPHPTLYHYLPFGPFNTLEDFLAWYRTRIEEDSRSFLFAVFDKSATRTHPTSDAPVHVLSANSNTESRHIGNVDSQPLAGIIGYLNTDPQHATAELGYLIILPRFQGTHVTRHAIGLLLRYALHLPGNARNGGGVAEQIGLDEIRGLGLRRVQYQANASNARSVRAAERMGFVREGVIRWQRVLGSEKEGKSGRREEQAWCEVEGGVAVKEGGWGPGRDTVLLAVCWDDWENGVRDRVDQVMKLHES